MDTIPLSLLQLPLCGMQARCEVEEQVRDCLEGGKEGLYASIPSRSRRAMVMVMALALVLIHEIESALTQHKLALQYYEFRSLYFVFLPVTLIAMYSHYNHRLSNVRNTTKDDDSDGTAQAQGSALTSIPL